MNSGEEFIVRRIEELAMSCFQEGNSGGSPSPILLIASALFCSDSCSEGSAGEASDNRDIAK
ncbi:hypothetical protein EAO79_12040 [Plantibacter sp. PA-3-X8]|nr:hypothetical protein EAO79_12040 [Plantibacter sp. PA-3-X8]